MAAASTAPLPLSLHDALPIWDRSPPVTLGLVTATPEAGRPKPKMLSRRMPRTAAPRKVSRARIRSDAATGDRKSTRLNSSHLVISYAVFCLKKQNHREHTQRR